MDDDSSERQLRGFRQRWHDRGSSHSLGAPVSEHSLVGDDEIDRILEGCLDSTGENPNQNLRDLLVNQRQIASHLDHQLQVLIRIEQSLMHSCRQ